MMLVCIKAQGLFFERTHLIDDVHSVPQQEGCSLCLVVCAVALCYLLDLFFSRLTEQHLTNTNKCTARTFLDKNLFISIICEWK